MQEVSPGTYVTAVLFVPLVQVVDYATYPFEELAGPIVPQASRQERVKLTRCKLDCEYFIISSLAPAEFFTFNLTWYLAKFSLQEVTNAIAAGDPGLFAYDPRSEDASPYFKHPIVRHGQDAWQQMAPGSLGLQDSFFSGFGMQTHHINFNSKMRLGLETDEEFYLVAAGSGLGPEEAVAPVFTLSLTCRTQLIT